MLVGLTGGIGSGKTLVANYFKELGVKVISADDIAKELTTKGSESLSEIVNKFGSEILNSDSTLNRKYLGQIVFKDSKKKQELENILHPKILKKIKQLYLDFKKSNKGYMVAEIPLLIETNFCDIVDRVLVVDCDKTTQISRVINRDNISLEQIQNIINNQASRTERLNKANDVIHNSGNLSDLKKEVANLNIKYIELSK